MGEEAEFDGPDAPLGLADTPEERAWICEVLLIEALLDPWRQCIEETGVGDIPLSNGLASDACERAVEEYLDEIPFDCTFREAYDCDFLDQQRACEALTDLDPLPSGVCRSSPPSRCSIFRSR